jgi:hypothetical protein
MDKVQIYGHVVRDTCFFFPPSPSFRSQAVLVRCPSLPLAVEMILYDHPDGP